jgi:hypothetical protein
MTYLVSIPISEDKELATFGVKRKQKTDEIEIDWFTAADVPESPGRSPKLGLVSILGASL